MSGNCFTCAAPLSGQQKKFCSEGCRKSEARRVRLAAQFNLTPDDYAMILIHQGGVCAICGKPPKAERSLSVDHDHKTGVVRGLLCFLCNRIIVGGRTPEQLVRAANYVTSPPAVQALGFEVIAPPRKRKRRTRKGKGKK